MKHKKKLMIIILLVFMISCDSMIIEDKKEFEAYDDELIEQIQNASNKIEIEYNDLPINAISTIENSYSTDTFLSELHASQLGYELTYNDIDTEQSTLKKIYFNLEGRKLISRRDKEKRDWKCFDLVFPVIYTMPDGSTISVTSDDQDGWQDLKDWYENNPDTEERPALQYPLEISYEDGTMLIVNDDEEMEEAKDNCTESDCLELVYPVSFTMPDGSSISVASDDDEGWQELKDWYETNPNYEFEWDIQYPVDVILEDGTVLTINEEEEIRTIKDSCE